MRSIILGLEIYNAFLEFLRLTPYTFKDEQNTYGIYRSICSHLVSFMGNFFAPRLLLRRIDSGAMTARTDLD